MKANGILALVGACSIVILVFYALSRLYRHLIIEDEEYKDFKPDNIEE
ncbi:MAG: hypothetical protein HGA22_13480 [Clostridiales bacterium]|nr:hypothetical protein [Clostridiales bacterium]